MTSEVRTTIQLSDFKAVEFECRQCHCRIVRPMGGVQPLLPNCPECGISWAQSRAVMEFLAKMVSQVPMASAIDKQTDSPFIVRFEIDTDKKP